MIHTPALDRIFYLSQEFTDPEGTEWAMRKHFNSTLKLQRKVVTRDTLQRLLETGTNDVVNASTKICKLINNNKENVQKKIVRFLMKMKVEDANNEIEKAKKEMSNNKLILRKYMRDETIVANEYRETVEKVCKQSWEGKRKQMKDKVNYLKSKRNDEDNLPGIYNGIKFGDKEIGEIEVQNEPRIH